MLISITRSVLMHKEKFRDDLLLAVLIGGHHIIDSRGRTSAEMVQAIPHQLAAVAVALPHQPSSRVSYLTQRIAFQPLYCHRTGIAVPYRIGENQQIAVILGAVRGRPTIADQTFCASEEDLPTQRINANSGNLIGKQRVVFCREMKQLLGAVLTDQENATFDRAYPLAVISSNSNSTDVYPSCSKRMFLG